MVTAIKGNMGFIAASFWCGDVSRAILEVASRATLEVACADTCVFVLWLK